MTGSPDEENMFRLVLNGKSMMDVNGLQLAHNLISVCVANLRRKL